jgi:hypothetical protein
VRLEFTQVDKRNQMTLQYFLPQGECCSIKNNGCNPRG